METQKTPIVKAILRKKNRAGGIRPLTSDYTTNYSHQNSMVVAQKQKYRSMEQDRGPTSKSAHLWSRNL